MKNVEPCEKHEVSNCAECSGAAKRETESLQETPDWTKRQEARAGVMTSDYDDIEYGPEIVAKYHGYCARCGRSYEAGSVIRYSKTEAAWIAECCL